MNLNNYTSEEITMFAKFLEEYAQYKKKKEADRDAALSSLNGKWVKDKK